MVLSSALGQVAAVVKDVLAFVGLTFLLYIAGYLLLRRMDVLPPCAEIRARPAVLSSGP
jgi:hypothetical protein